LAGIRAARNGSESAIARREPGVGGGVFPRAMPGPLVLFPLLALAQAPALEWDAARAEHLWNRAGFGANTATIERSLALGPVGLVDALLKVDGWIEEPFYARIRADADLTKYVRNLPAEEREKRMSDLRMEDQGQADDFLEWWVGRMLAGEEPLRERMVL